jgi:hypothetical protein
LRYSSQDESARSGGRQGITEANIEFSNPAYLEVSRVFCFSETIRTEQPTKGETIEVDDGKNRAQVGRERDRAWLAEAPTGISQTLQFKGFGGGVPQTLFAAARQREVEEPNTETAAVKPRVGVVGTTKR